MEKVLSLSEYTLRYDKRTVLNRLSLNTYKREVHAICGMADSGIGYFANALLRTHPCRFRETGDIKLAGTFLNRLTDEEMRYIRLLDIGIIHHDLTDPSNGLLNVKQFLLSPYKEPLKKSKKEVYIDALRIMELMGVKRASRIFLKKLSSLSRKELRAVLVASALSSDPSVVLLSVIGKQIQGDDELYNLIIKICKIKDIALIILTSDIAFAAKYAERVTVLDKGEVVESFYSGRPPVSFQAKFLQSPREYYEKLPFRCDDVLASYENLFVYKENRTLDFDLYQGEIVGIHTPFVNRTVGVLSGRRRPKRGVIIKNSNLLNKIKPCDRGVFVIHEKPYKMFLPQTEVSILMDRFLHLRKNIDQEIDINLIFESLDLDMKLLNTRIDSIDDFTCMRLCLAFAVIGSCDTIIVRQPHMFCSAAEQYSLLSYIKKLCQRGISFIFVSDSREFISVISDNYCEIN